jgi:diguanylate cyclase (GGDEF)-like protein
VWVRRTAEAPENPYLRSLGVEPNTTTASGLELTLRNPSPMTTEISRYVAQAGEVQFHLTSLKLVNPDNAPDPWERLQLLRFAEDPTSAEQIDLVQGRRYYRNIRPLFVEEQCLQCHRSQGYRVGDVRGGITVSIPLAATDADLRRNAVALSILYLIVMAGVGYLMYQLFYRMAARVDDTEDKLFRMATTDELTGLPNRRAVMERLNTEIARAARDGSSIGVASVDADLFKRVNDTYGHEAGDRVLRAIGERLASAVREYDIVARVGGEEFLVVAPSVDDAELDVLGERLRAAVAAVPVRQDHIEIPMTVSVGIALWTLGTSSDDILKQADNALYRAKDQGRNRVERA